MTDTHLGILNTQQKKYLTKKMKNNESNPDTLDQIDQSRSDPGNTGMQGPLANYWFFTYNSDIILEENDENQWLDQIDHLDQQVWAKFLAVIKNECVWYVAQEERAPTTGRVHLQGTLKWKSRKRLTGCKKFQDEVHWELTKFVKPSIEYCLKPESRVGRQYVYGIEIKDEIIVERPWGWQLDVMDIIKQKPDPRKIHWFWEPYGNVGKSTLCKYLAVHHQAVILSGKSADMFHRLKLYMDTNINGPKLVIIDIPRSQQDFVNYGAIEMIKNGLVFSGKYEGGQLVFNNPHIICFANEEPMYDKMSLDRWSVIKILYP